MSKLSRSQFLQLSVMLFGLFFGAGNLIFPPLLGNQAGSAMFLALLSFAVTAVIFPVLGTIAVGKTGGLSVLARRVGPLFSIVFTTAIYLSIGPGLGIPRAGSVPFEMAIAPYLSNDVSPTLVRLVYTFVFFSTALWICFKPNQLVKRIGKYLTPVLLVLIVAMFARLMMLPKSVAPAVGNYAKAPVVQGFVAGYGTMDAIAALNFGFVISMAVRRFGIKDDHRVTQYTKQAGIIAGLMLFLVYAMLSMIGMISSETLAGAKNGAVILSHSMQSALGDFGLVPLASIFTLACLTTCVGLITSGAEYFHHLFHEKLSYRTWVIVWTGCSFLTANFGLNTLLAYSVPLLTVIYPVSLVLIVMGMTQERLHFGTLSYRAAAFVSVLFPLFDMLRTTFSLQLLPKSLYAMLPLSENGLGWMVPTLIVLLVARLVEKFLLPTEKSQIATPLTDNVQA